MADDTKPDMMTTYDAYFARFGDDADFDRWTMGEDPSLALMQHALARGTPVTRADMEKMHEAVYGEPYEDPPEGALT